MNAISTTGEKGMDFDTFDISGQIDSSTTEAYVRLSTRSDGFFLSYIILSLRSDRRVKEEFNFRVDTLTYEYGIGYQVEDF